MKSKAAIFPFFVFSFLLPISCSHQHHLNHLHDNIFSGHDHYTEKQHHDNIGHLKCGFKSPTHEQEEANKKRLQSYREKMGEEFFERTKRDVININVYVHVMMSSDGSNGFLQTETIEKQIDILNGAFNGENPMYLECGGQGQQFTYGNNYATPFRFELKDILDYYDSDAFDLMSENSDSLRRRERRGSCRDLNIYTGNFQDFLGMASLPENCAGDMEGDSVTINYKSFPDLGIISNYDQGDTLVHEVGHWLGLLHTFEGFNGNNGCTDPNGDFITDTPAQASETTGCPIGRDSCPFDGADPIHNFMDYSYDCCLYQFTQGQSDRMFTSFGAYRSFGAVTSSPTPEGTGDAFASNNDSLEYNPAPTGCRKSIDRDKLNSKYLHNLINLVLGKIHR